MKDTQRSLHCPGAKGASILYHQAWLAATILHIHPSHIVSSRIPAKAVHTQELTLLVTNNHPICLRVSSRIPVKAVHIQGLTLMITNNHPICLSASRPNTPTTLHMLLKAAIQHRMVLKRCLSANKGFPDLVLRGILKPGLLAHMRQVYMLLGPF